MIGIMDFGSQYVQVIARRIRELRVYCEIVPHTTTAEDLRRKGVKGVILSGGPGHIPDSGALPMDRTILDGPFPVLGICYGMQLIAKLFGGRVASGKTREYGKAIFFPDSRDPLFWGVKAGTVVWMSHWDYVSRVPPGFRGVGRTDDCPAAAIRDAGGRIYGLQFHPEVAHTRSGRAMLRNFLFRVCRLKPEWNSASMLTMAEEIVRRKVGNGRVICALSGGVDSSCLSLLLHEVAGKRSLSVFVNNGVMRLGECEKIVEMFRKKVNLKYVDAADLFLRALKGVTDPEEKRRIIGRTFIEVFRREARSFGADFLAQGTLYPDVIESSSPFGGPSARIKTHHNVGGLPRDLDLALVEPFRYLFKDEVRRIGREMGVPAIIVNRQPFPGPGLAVRILGEVTPGSVATLQKADAIVLEEVKRAGLYEKVWQSFAVLLPTRSVGIMGDVRTYENAVALRIVRSSDGMTADWVRIPYRVLERISSRIVNEVRGVNRVVYDVTSKPPATIEWE